MVVAGHLDHSETQMTMYAQCTLHKQQLHTKYANYSPAAGVC